MRENNYNTKQKEEIYSFLEKNANTLYSIKEIKNKLDIKKISIGLTTLYRILNKLSEDNKIIVYTEKYEKKFGYFKCCEDDYYHLICISCGAVEHINQKIYVDFCKSISSIHNFKLNTEEKFLEGWCQRCI